MFYLMERGLVKMSKEILQRVLERAKKVKNTLEWDVSDNYDTPLTGNVFRMSAIDMTYLFLELMDEFQIKFDAADVNDYGFNTVNNIVRIIENKLP